MHINLKTSPIFDNFFMINGSIYSYVKCQINYIFLIIKMARIPHEFRYNIAIK